MNEMTATSPVRKVMGKLPVSKLLKIGSGLLYIVGLAIAAWFVFNYVREQVTNAEILPEFTIRKSATEQQSSNIEVKEGATLPDWTGTDRITFLIMGIDERAQEDDFWRTDTMMIVTLDPVTMKAGVLSIPRDLWVHIPGYVEDRINTAHRLGDMYDHPGGGPALAIETIRYNLGIDIDYYARFNFQAFVELVDRIGGIEIDVPEVIDDPTYPDYNYGYDPLHIEPGLHHFYGEEALKYARTRHSNGGDFDRARRQQQVILAIFEKVTQLNMLPQLAVEAPEILKVLGDSVLLDPKLQLDELIALANLALEVNTDDIEFKVIDETCTLFKITPDEMMILVPLRDQIREVRDDFLGLNNGDNGALQTVEEEASTISILNGTQTAGLAYTTSEFLTANNLNIAAYDNADRQDYDTSIIILNRDKPVTAAQLLSLLKLPESAIVNGSNPTAQYDIIVILGADYATTQE